MPYKLLHINPQMKVEAAINHLYELTAENARLREALEEIVEHGESDCYVIALHALEKADE